ncbi:hypothetical protein C2S53_014575 [Perilla frutescens var. hirtella]|uniref:RBR-type E3 ubiquitin transferase n=1 Tax=Perilla frutescens var. hirtella TaxID=608512 RepID=A0AAD4IRF5_PERFH|nr:hypothetical protein C2S53_014575 [Perilla frutescens var. hirtella]
MEESQEQIALSCNDDFIVSIIINSSENPSTINETQSLMSDDEFAQELQLQEVIISSLINLPPKTAVKIGDSSPPPPSTREVGESSNSHSLCEICAEKKDAGDMFPLKNCSHNFCNDCISRHISIKIKKRTIIGESSAAIPCPGSGCGGALDAAACRAVVPLDVVGVWDEVLCESTIALSERVYCPYKNCSALLVNDGAGGGGGVIREAECPFCRRLFCASCGVPWHSGIDCEGFSKLGKDEREREDIMVHDLARKNKWRRCSNCNFFVERNEGCLHMTCRCGYEFCYACGNVWSSTHGGCQ